MKFDDGDPCAQVADASFLASLRHGQWAGAIGFTRSALVRAVWTCRLVGKKSVVEPAALLEAEWRGNMRQTGLVGEFVTRYGLFELRRDRCMISVTHAGRVVGIIRHPMRWRGWIFRSYRVVELCDAGGVPFAEIRPARFRSRRRMPSIRRVGESSHEIEFDPWEADGLDPAPETDVSWLPVRTIRSRPLMERLASAVFSGVVTPSSERRTFFLAQPPSTADPVFPNPEALARFTVDERVTTLVAALWVRLVL
jgi:hypothetical protein